MQMAGLVLYYDDTDYYYLRVTADEIRGTSPGVVLCKAGKYDEISSMQISVKHWEVCTPLDFGTLSDEYGGKLGFTGAYVGICAQDLDQQAKPAYFDYFEYKSRG